MLFVSLCPGFHAAKAVGLGQPADPSGGEPEINGYGHESIRLHLHFIYHCLASHPWTRTAETFSPQSHSPSQVNWDIRTVLYLALGLLRTMWCPCGLKIPAFPWSAAEQLSSVVFNSMTAGLPGVCPVVWYEALWRVLEDAKSGEIVTVLEGLHTTGEAKTAVASMGILPIGNPRELHHF